MSITFGNEEQLSAFVSSADLEASVHSALTCQACHADISMDSHPGGKSQSKADFLQKASRRCRTCHSDERLKARPTHGFAVSQEGAPPCSECHGGHNVARVSAWKDSLPGNEYCLLCHRTTLSKTHHSGEVLALQIDPANLGASVHNRHACSDCHAGFSRDAHPVSILESGRQHSLLMAGICSPCHADKAALVKGSVHYNLSLPGAGDLGTAGKPNAPVCTDCHGFHTVGPKESYQTISGVPCRKCHEGIFAVYEKSVHGMARAMGEHRTPLCSSCHFAHSIAFTAATGKMKAACLGCHAGAENTHQAWLPNAKLHLDVIACSACHAPAAGKGIYLQVVDRETSLPIKEDRILEILGTDSAGLTERLGAHGEGIDSAELSFILKQLNRRGGQARVSFVGRMDVTRYSDAHQLSLRSSAVKECESCHSKASQFFKTVSLAVVAANGRVATFKAKPDTLGSLRSAGVTGGFYVLGGTRITTLDWLGALMVAAGALIPAAHIVLRMLTARYRARRKTPAGGAPASLEHTYLHPLAVRLWHWLNATVFLFLVFTGIELRYQDVASITQFKSSVAFHNALGVLMIVGYAFWLCYYLCSGQMRLYLPLLHQKAYIRRTVLQVRYYGCGVFRGEPNPHHPSAESKFNPLQQIAYFVVMLGLLPVQFGTGILLMDVSGFGAAIDRLGGLTVVDGVHVVASFALVAFLFVHVYLVTLGGSPLEHIRAMVTGYKALRAPP